MDIRTVILTSVILKLILTASIRDEQIIAAITKISSSGNISVEDKHKLQAMLGSINKCRSLPFRQSVTQKGCKEVIINNKFCVGGCLTRTLPSIEGVPSKNSNFRCVPANIRFIDVLFDCTNGRKKGKSIKIVESCVCESS